MASIYTRARAWGTEQQVGDSIRRVIQKSAARLCTTPWQTLALQYRPVLLGLGVLLLIIWKVPQWQAARWEGRIEPKEVAKQESDTRTTIVQAIGGAVVLVGLWITWRNMRLTEKNIQITQDNALRTAEITREGQITDRFTKAIAQLGETGPDKLAIRLGGIYALERIARDSERDHWPIMEVLTAYVREHVRWEEEEPGSKEEREPSELQPRQDIQPLPGLPIDIQAILTVLGRRTRMFGKEEEQRLDLSQTDLPRASLRGAQLQGADLRNAHLEGAQNLTVQQLVTVSTLYQAQLDPPLLEAIEQHHPKLLEAPQI